MKLKVKPITQERDNIDLFNRRTRSRKNDWWLLPSSELKNPAQAHTQTYQGCWSSLQRNKPGAINKQIRPSKTKGGD